MMAPDTKFNKNPFSGVSVVSCSETEAEISVGCVNVCEGVQKLLKNAQVAFS